MTPEERLKKAKFQAMMERAQVREMPIGETASQPPLGGISARKIMLPGEVVTQPSFGYMEGASQPPMGGIVANPLEDDIAIIIAKPKGSGLRGEAEIFGETEVQYSPIKNYLKKKKGQP